MLTVADARVDMKIAVTMLDVAMVRAGGVFDALPPATTVVVEYPTVMDGVVFRWFRSVEDAEDSVRNEVMSASRNGVMVPARTYLGDVPVAWVAAAADACRRLRRSGGAEPPGLVTHRFDRYHRLVPVVRDVQEAGEVSGG